LDYCDLRVHQSIQFDVVEKLEENIMYLNFAENEYIILLLAPHEHIDTFIDQE